MENEKTAYPPSTSVLPLFDHNYLNTLPEVDTHTNAEVSYNLAGAEGTIEKWLDSFHELLINSSGCGEKLDKKQFVESFTSGKVPREVAEELFEQFDLEGTGRIDVDDIGRTLDLFFRFPSSRSGIRSNIKAVTKLYQDCRLQPDFIDCLHSDAVHEQPDRGHRLLKFLQRNRLDVTSLTHPALKQFMERNEKQLKMIQLGLSGKTKASNATSSTPDEVHVSIKECVSSIEASSNDGSSNDDRTSYLLDDDPDTWWKSSDTSFKHWLRFNISPNVVVNQLSLYLSKDDKTYMPEHVVVWGGRHKSSLTELNDIRIPYETKDHVILNHNTEMYSVLQIEIKRCHQDGKGCHVRGVKLWSNYQRDVTNQSDHTTHALSASWYFTLLTDTAQATLSIAPSLKESLLKHTRTLISTMEPFSLISLSSRSSSSPSQAQGLISSQTVVSMKKFLTGLIDDETPSGEVLMLLLHFELAAGNLGGIFQVLHKLLQRIDVEYPKSNIHQLLHKSDEKWRRKNGLKIDMSLIYCDGGVDENKVHPDSVLSNDSTQAPYLTAIDKTKCTMVFQPISGNLIQLTKVVLKVSGGKMTPGPVLVFTCSLSQITDEHGKIDPEKFQEFDGWSKEDFDKHKKTRKTKSDSLTIHPIAYCSAKKSSNPIRLDLNVDDVLIGNCIVVKFLKPTIQKARQVRIMKIQFFGFDVKKQEFLYISNLSGRQKGVEKGFTNDAYSLELLIVEILRLLRDMCHVSSTKKFDSINDCNKNHCLNFDELSVDKLWDVYEFRSQTESSEIDSNPASEMVLNIFHSILPWLILEKNKWKISTESSSTSNSVTITDIGNNSINNNSNNNNNSNSSNNNNNNNSSNINNNKNDKDPSSHDENFSHVFQSLCDIVDGSHEVLAECAKQIILDGCELFFLDDQTRVKHLLSLANIVKLDSEPPSVFVTFNSLCKYFIQKNDMLLISSRCSEVEEQINPESINFVLRTLLSFERTLDAPSPLTQLLCKLQNSLLKWCYNNIQKDQNFQLLKQYIELVCKECAMTLQSIDSSEDKLSTVDELESSFVSFGLRHLVMFSNQLCEKNIAYASLLPTFCTLWNNVFKVCADVTISAPKDPEHNVDGEVLREWIVDSREDKGAESTRRYFHCIGCEKYRVEFYDECRTRGHLHYLEFSDSSDRKRRFFANIASDMWPKNVKFKGYQNLRFQFCSPENSSENVYRFKVQAIGSAHTVVHWLHDLNLNVGKCVGGLCRKSLSPNMNIEGVGGYQALAEDPFWMILTRAPQGSDCGPLNSDAHITVCEIAECQTNRAKSFINRFKEQTTTIGSDVNVVFAALIWHNLNLRKQVTAEVSQETDSALPTCFKAAYDAAETMKGNFCKEKASILLEFEGLTLDDCDTSQTTPDQLILDFLTNDSISNKDIKTAMNRRREHVETMIATYKIMSQISNLYHVANNDINCKFSILCFLHSLASANTLSYLHLHSLSGCPIDIQNKARDAFYAFVSSPVDILQSESVNKDNDTAWCHYLRLYILSLMNMDWQPRDYPFLNQINLPQILSNCSKGMQRSEQDDDDAEVEMLERHKDFSKKIQQTGVWEFNVNYRGRPPSETMRDKNVFVARYSFAHGDESMMYCNGCSDEIEAFHGHYRCLECMDVDLCGDCYKNDVTYDDTDDDSDSDTDSDDDVGEWKKHVNTHNMMHLWWGCNGCDMFITRTRTRCVTCASLDLCLSCYRKEIYKSPRQSSKHESTHKVIVTRRGPIHATRRQEPINDTTVQSFVHQFSWLPLCALALRALQSLQISTTQNQQINSRTDSGQLLLSCLKCLVECVSEEKSSSKTSPASTIPSTGVLNSTINPATESIQEDDFLSPTDNVLSTESRDTNYSSHLGEKVLCLISTLLSHNMVENLTDDLSSKFRSFFSENLLPLLFKETCNGQSSRTQHLCFAVLAKTLHCCGAVEGDEVVSRLIKDMKDEHIQLQSERPAGYNTVKFLLTNTCEKFNLKSIHGLFAALKTPSSNEIWIKSISSVINDHVAVLSSTTDLLKPPPSSVLSLLLICGHSERLEEGMLGRLRGFDGKMNDMAITRISSDREYFSVILLSGRKSIEVKSVRVEPVPMSITLSTPTLLQTLVETVGIYLLDCETNPKSTDHTRKLFMLGISLKALINVLSSSNKQEEDIALLVYAGILRRLVSLACEGTGLSRQWRGEELMSLLYTQLEKNGMSKIFEESEDNKEVPAKADAADVSSWPTNSSVDSNEQTNQGDDEDKNSHLNTVESASSTDLDSGILMYQNPKNQITNDSENKKSPDCNANEQQSPLQGVNVSEILLRNKRINSLTLLNLELNEELNSMEEMKTSRTSVQQVSHAIVVLHARQLLGRVLTGWPQTSTIQSSHLNDISPRDVLGLLELIRIMETEQNFSSIVSNFVRCSSSELLEDLMPLAVNSLTVAEVVSKTCEHDKKNTDKLNAVILQGCTRLSVTFNQLCSTEDDLDELIISSSADLIDHRHVFSGTDGWDDFELPGDTLYYIFKYQSDVKWNEKWKFTVTGTQCGIAGTGYQVVKALIVNDRWTSSLQQLWKSLITLGCNGVEDEQKVVIDLLKRVLQISMNRKSQEDEKEDELRLSLLQPLYELYKQCSNSSNSQEIREALSELFVVASESGSSECGQFFSNILSQEQVGNCVRKALGNIAAVAITVGFGSDSEMSSNNALDLLNGPNG